MTEFTMDRLRENLEALKMKNTLEILSKAIDLLTEKQTAPQLSRRRD